MGNEILKNAIGVSDLASFRKIRSNNRRTYTKASENVS
jgi:hypothetical protein